MIEVVRCKGLATQVTMSVFLMDCCASQFADESFDLILDKGGLDALMGNEDSTAGRQFLSEVRRRSSCSRTTGWPENLP